MMNKVSLKSVLYGSAFNAFNKNAVKGAAKQMMSQRSFFTIQRSLAT